MCVRDALYVRGCMCEEMRVCMVGCMCVLRCADLCTHILRSKLASGIFLFYLLPFLLKQVPLNEPENYHFG